MYVKVKEIKRATCKRYAMVRLWNQL